MVHNSHLSKTLQFLKSSWQAIVEWCFLTWVYFSSILPMRDFDIWFHLKAGELLVSQKHLPIIETFSYSAAGRTWYPHEWLFEVISYLVTKISSMQVLPYLNSFGVVLLFWAFLKIQGQIFRVALLPRLILSFFLLISTLEFNTVRPHVLAYAFVGVTIYFILAKIFHNRRLIYLLPFITLFWANWHSSVFLSWGLPLAFAVLYPRKDLFLVSAINFVITFLPPLGIEDYRLLFDFFTDRKFLSTFISEWSPLGDNPVGMTIYTLWVVPILGLIGWQTYKDRFFKARRLLLPLLLIILMGYSASRNQVMANFALFLLVGFALKDLKPLYLTLILIPFFLFYTYLGTIKLNKIKNDRLYYPIQAAEFSKRFLKGNMFNEYSYGGYLIYHGYPENKVFIDGRAELYHRNEMIDYQKFAIYKYQDDDSYQKTLNEFWQKYQIDYAIISVQKHAVMRRISKLLNDSPDWALVFWDDDSQIFVKKNGKNDRVVNELEVKSATPYLKSLYRQGQSELAYTEYTRMQDIAPSARNLNALGYLLLQQQDLSAASSLFDQAIKLDPTFESPYMNKAEILANDGHLDRAIDLYYTAQKKAPDRGLIYIRLGQLLLQQNPNNNDKVKKIWRDGIKQTVDEDAKTKLQELLNSI